MILLFVITVVLVVALVGSLPVWPHSKNWGYYPMGGVGAVILILLILFFASPFRPH
jgi:hypothetical protein